MIRGILRFVVLVVPCGIAWLLFLCGRDNRAMWCGAVGTVTGGVPWIGGTRLGGRADGLLCALRVAGGERQLATVSCTLSLGVAHNPVLIRLCPGWGAAGRGPGIDDAVQSC